MFILIVSVVVLVLIPTAAFGASDASVSAKMNGSTKIDVTVTDTDGTYKDTINWEKNKTINLTVGAYKVAVETNGSGIKGATIVSSAPPPTSATNAPAPKPGVSLDGASMTWNAIDQAAVKAKFTQSKKNDKAIPATALAPVVSKKTDASGDKIPSNAHSGDYPGLYFYWNDKQTEDGFLKVDPAVFDLFKPDENGKVGFFITAKNSNAYWDYWIYQNDPKAVLTSEGYYLYQIPRYFMITDKANKVTNDELKNINMIFIGGNYKDAYFNIVKNWFNEDGTPVDPADVLALNELLKFNNKYTLGLNTVSIDNYKDALLGKKIVVTESIPAGWSEKFGKSSQTVTAKQKETYNTVTFNNQKKYANIIIEKVWLDADLNVIEDADGLEATFEINGDLADLGAHKVKEGEFVVAETSCTAGYTLHAITVEPLIDDFDFIDLDAGAALFGVAAGKTVTVTFYNQAVKITTKFGIDIEKWVDGQFVLDWNSDDYNIYDLMDMMYFKIYATDSKGGLYDLENPLGVGELTDAGVISFGTLELDKGWYVIEEFLDGLGEEVFYPAAPLYVYVGEYGTYVGESFAWVSGEHFGTKVSHDGNGVNWVLPDVWEGVLAGQPAYEQLKKMGAFWVWDAVDTYQYGVSGSVYEESFTFTAEEAGTVQGYLAADNAAVVYVNGILAGYTEVAFNTPGNTPAENYGDFDFGALNASVFDGGWALGWNHSYGFEINYNEGLNTVTIIAANSARTYGTGTDNDGYDTTNNPCGVLFGFITPPEAVFHNETITPPKSGIDIAKNVDDGSIVLWALDEGYSIYDLMEMMVFELFKKDENGAWVFVAEGSLLDNGQIAFGTIEEFDPGEYKLVETLIDDGLLIFEDPEDYFFTVYEEVDFEGIFDNYTPTPPPGLSVYDKIPSKRHVDRWWNDYGILAYGASSNTDKFDYFFGFSETFWDENDSVTIGFGTKGSLQGTYVITYDDGLLKCDDIDFRNHVYETINFDQHYTGKEKLYPFKISVGAYFDNPGASGKQQLWLISLQPKAVKTETIVETASAMALLDLGDPGPFDPAATGDEGDSVADPAEVPTQDPAPTTEAAPAVLPDPTPEPEPAVMPEPDPEPEE